VRVVPNNLETIGAKSVVDSSGGHRCNEGLHGGIWRRVDDLERDRRIGSCVAAPTVGHRLEDRLEPRGQTGDALPARIGCSGWPTVWRAQIRLRPGSCPATLSIGSVVFLTRGSSDPQGGDPTVCAATQLPISANSRSRSSTPAARFLHANLVATVTTGGSTTDFAPWSPRLLRHNPHEVCGNAPAQNFGAYDGVGYCGKKWNFCTSDGAILRAS